MDDGARCLLERVRHCALPQGEIPCRGTWLRQKGEMRLAPGRAWLPFTAEEWFEGDGIDFRWQAKVRRAPLLTARVVDSYRNGTGVLTAAIMRFIPVARSSGPLTDEAEALRGLSELPWHPLAFRETERLTWRSGSDTKLQATYREGKIRAIAEFDIDEQGHVLGGTATRGRMAGKSLVDTPWSGIFSDYRIFDRFRIPAFAEATWHLPEGPFPYWRGQITEFRVIP